MYYTLVADLIGQLCCDFIGLLSVLFMKTPKVIGAFQSIFCHG